MVKPGVQYHPHSQSIYPLPALKKILQPIIKFDFKVKNN